MKIISVLFLLYAFSSSVGASLVEGVKINKVFAGPQFGNNVFISVSVKPASPPSCQSNSTYSYVFDGTTDSGKMTLSIVLSAYAAQNVVNIGGGGVCTNYHNIENLNYIISE